MHLINLISLEPSALDLDICQQRQEQGGIVDLPIHRRSKSLRDLLQAEISVPQSAKFSTTDDQSSAFSAKTNFSYDVNRSSPISEDPMGSISSSGRITLLELFNSDGEHNPRSDLKGREMLSWKLSIQSIRARFKEKQAQKNALKALSSESDVDYASKKVQTETFCKSDATEKQSDLQKAVSRKKDDELEKFQFPILLQASSQARNSGWGKTEVNPPSLGSSSRRCRVTFARQFSTSSVHEQYYISRRTAGVRERKRTYLPYREQLISFFCCIPEQSCSIV